MGSHVPNHYHFKYYILLIDDCSRLTWLYLMKERFEVFSQFMLFVNEIRTQHSAHIKVFRSDNALEYTSFMFKHYFHSHGILMNPHVPIFPNKMGL